MTVKRYTPTQCCEHDGTYVTYSDYQKLLAENAALKSSVPALKEVSYENDSFDDVSIAEEIGFNEAVRMTINNMQSTPATDAAIAEINAQGVDSYADNLQKIVESALLAGHEITAIDIDRETFRVRNFAANLRAGRKG